MQKESKHENEIEKKEEIFKLALDLFVDCIVWWRIEIYAKKERDSDKQEAKKKFNE